MRKRTAIDASPGGEKGADIRSRPSASARVLAALRDCDVEALELLLEHDAFDRAARQTRLPGFT